MHLTEITLALTQQHLKIVRHIFRNHVHTLLSKYNVIDLGCKHVVFHFWKLLYDLYFTFELGILTWVYAQAFDDNFYLLSVMDCFENFLSYTRKLAVLQGQFLGQSWDYWFLHLWNMFYYIYLNFVLWV